MIWRIDVFPQQETPSKDLIAQIKDLGIEKDVKVFCKKVYFIEGSLSKEDAETLAGSLLIDPVTENYLLSEGLFKQKPDSNEIIITYNPGVSDPVTLSLEKAIKDLRFSVKSTRISRLYKFKNLTPGEIEETAQRLLYNPLIEHILDYEKTKNIESLDEFSASTYKFKLVNVDILSADCAELKDISSDGCLS
jgi:phosphoribosylformylglycinamidine (FGAM) synthase PurS component